MLYDTSVLAYANLMDVSIIFESFSKAGAKALTEHSAANDCHVPYFRGSGIEKCGWQCVSAVTSERAVVYSYRAATPALCAVTKVVEYLEKLAFSVFFEVSPRAFNHSAMFFVLFLRCRCRQALFYGR